MRTDKSRGGLDVKAIYIRYNTCIQVLQPDNTACFVLCGWFNSIAVPGTLLTWYAGQNGKAP